MASHCTALAVLWSDIHSKPIAQSDFMGTPAAVSVHATGLGKAKLTP